MFRLLLLSLIGLSCGDNNAQNKLDATAFETKLKTTPDVQLVDVRTPEEFKSGHLEGALNYNIHGAEYQQQIAQLDKNKPVLVYCGVGGRSATACAQLDKAGFGQVYDLAGGIAAWKKAGKKVVE